MSLQLIQILLVEDDSFCAKAAQRELEWQDRSEFRVHHVSTLGEALDRLAEETFDAMILDMSLPDASGIDTLLRARAAAPAVPIIILTASEDEDLALRVIQKGAQEYVSKGNNRHKVLVRAVRHAIERKRTERKMQKELQQVAQRAEAASRAKSDFLANMSHEIRTPMTSILGFTEFLYTEGNMASAPPERIEAIETIRRNGLYLMDIINDILDMSKIEAGKIDIEQIDCSPQEIVEEVAATMKYRADSKNLSLRVEYDGPIPEVIRADPTRLRQILVNLLGNAVKFTEHGEVRLVLRYLASGSGRDRSEPALEFAVIDTGIGMSAAQLEVVFQPFSQADSSTTRKFGGTGLGLAISQRLADLLGGGIQAESTPGEGSTFRATISVGSSTNLRLVDPADHAIEDRGDQSLTTEGQTRKLRLDGRVLLAEDGPDNQRLISFLLTKAGATVTLADNGQIAFDLAITAAESHDPYEVILMDMQMPVLDGYEATARLREAGYDGPIVALTAHAMRGDRQKCLDAGCNDYVSKPIEKLAFIKTVHHWMSRQRQSGQQTESR